MDPLLLAYVGDDGGDVICGEAFDTRHVSEGPVMGSYSPLHCEEVGTVAVVVGCIQLGELRGAPVGSPEICAVTCCTMRCVELLACGDAAGVLRRDHRLGALPARAHDKRHRSHRGQRRPPHGAGLTSTLRRSWALAATITVDALISAAAAAGASAIPAQASTPAASGMASTL